MSAVPCRYLGSRVGDVHTMTRIVDPGRSPVKSASMVPEVLMVSIVMEEVIVTENRVSEPTWVPSPETPASPTAKIEAEVTAKSEAKAECWVI